MKQYQNYIDGKWTAPAGHEYEEITNPANTEEVLAQSPLSTEEDVQRAAQAGDDAAQGWAAVPAPQRGRILYKLADLLEADCETLGAILTKEEGKTFSEACGEVRHSAGECRYMASEAFRLEGRVFPSESAGGMVCHVKEPLGQIAAINPWNFPVVTPIRKIAPALACGDTVLFKPAASTPGTAVRLMELFEQAGVPAGVVNLVCGAGRTIGDAICASPQIKGISFTGSTQVGRRIAAMAGERMTRVQLEMGGKNPAVVWNPPDMDFCAVEIAKACYGGTGQKCTAISKVVVKRDQRDELVEKIAAYVNRLVVGDGMKQGVTMGPLASRQQFESVMRYMELARREATVVVCAADACDGCEVRRCAF